MTDLQLIRCFAEGLVSVSIPAELGANLPLGAGDLEISHVF